MKIDDLVAAQDMDGGPRIDEKLLSRIRAIMRENKKRVKVSRPENSEFPEVFVDVPDAWPYVDLAPLFDVHLGHGLHNKELFHKHWKWLRRAPYTLTFDGGDFIENANKLSVGNGVYEQEKKLDEQAASAAEIWASLAHKTIFKLPGNHEARTTILGMDVAAWLAALVEVPYFPDFCFCTIRFRGNKFRLLAHHGSGAATTAGAQRMAARKDLSWAHGFDIIWTGHLHNPIVDPIYQTGFDPKTGRAYERTGMVLISPSYLKYFGGYGATKRYPPGQLGLHVLRLQPDGRIDASVHARGRRT
jgi:hypothetical protein